MPRYRYIAYKYLCIFGSSCSRLLSASAGVFHRCLWCQMWKCQGIYIKMQHNHLGSQHVLDPKNHACSGRPVSQFFNRSETSDTLNTSMQADLSNTWRRWDYCYITHLQQKKITNSVWTGNSGIQTLVLLIQNVVIHTYVVRVKFRFFNRPARDKYERLIKSISR